MKKIITAVVLVSLLCIGSNRAFAHWRCPIIEIVNPNPAIFQNDDLR